MEITLHRTTDTLWFGPDPGRTLEVYGEFDAPVPVLNYEGKVGAEATRFVVTFYEAGNGTPYVVLRGFVLTAKEKRDGRQNSATSLFGLKSQPVEERLLRALAQRPDLTEVLAGFQTDPQEA